ncbi:afadin-like, partial [Poecilia latipinna]|uniref:afadin-like n=1 Tax=Poecilia latipinna TaxID=48699 RepID=UPI00072EB0D2
PKNLKELRSFLGFSGYYRRFVQGYSAIVKPLHDLTAGYPPSQKKLRPTVKPENYLNPKAPFGGRWTPVCQQAFETIIEKLTTAPVLAFADPQKPYTLHTDASSTGLGAVLYQEQDGKNRVVAYASRGLSRSESKYPAHKLEFLALKWAVTEKFNDYLYGAQFTVVTDSNPLTYLLSSAKLDATSYRWLSALSTFTFKIIYRAGKQNIDADGLSRRPHGELFDDPTSRKEHERVLKFAQQHLNEPDYVSIDQHTIEAVCARHLVYSSDVHLDHALVLSMSTHVNSLPDSFTDDEQFSSPLLPRFSADDIAAKQRDDPVIRHVIAQLERGESPSPSQEEKTGKEVILDDLDCPLQILRDWPADRGAMVFQLKKRPPDYQARKGRKDDKGLRGKDGSMPPEKLPYLVELSPGRGNHYAYYAYRHQEDGSDSRDKPKLYRLQHSITEVGSDCTEDGAIQLLGPGILPHHCNLMHSEGMVTVTPHGHDADTFVDGQRITETTVLRSGSTLQFGSAHVFKFVDPMFDQGGKRDPNAAMRSRHKSGSVPETTFDLRGDVHSGAPLPTSKSSGKLEMERGMVKPMIRGEQQDSRSQDLSADRTELTLPASIDFRENSEDTFLSAIINYTNSSTVHFKLSPTYVLYMACRYVLSPTYRPDMSPSERTHKVIAIVNKMVSMMEGVIQEIAEGDQKQKNIAGALAFWMANASELLNFIKQDRDLSRVTLDAQDILAHLVQMAFKYLVHCLQADLNNYMPAFLDDPEEHNPQRPKIEDVLQTLTGAMSLLRRCRVNAALTIQLFSQLFHFINMWLFNKLVTDADSGLCCHYWGAILRQQLSHIESWAEKQGLELAADCHLSRIVQATTLLTMDKYSTQDVQNIHNTCFKLNSLQLHALMTNYRCAQDEPYIPPDLIDHVVAVAENTADELARSDGREVQLEEDPDLQLPFLLPEDGYSCDVVRHLPNGLQDFLEPLLQRGFCRLTPHPRSPGTWTVHFEGADNDNHFSAADNTEMPMRKEPEVVTVTLKKTNGMGLSIVAAKGAGQEKLGIYIKSVVKGGAADKDGRLAAGDQLLSVDGRSLVGLSQERAAELMTRTGSVVTLEVAKQGAIYHGLATLLNQPSPLMQRASDRGRDKNGKMRPKSEGFELYNNAVQNGDPESPQPGWDSYAEPKKMSGEDRLLKNRADHRSSPNVANQGQSPATKSVYPGGPGTKITSVSTGNLCADDEPSPPRPEAYPIPTQTYPREYFTIPASKSQDRVVGPGQGPPQHWQGMEDRERLPVVDNIHSNSMQRINHSQEDLYPPVGMMRPDERMQPLYPQDYQHRDLDYQHRGLPGGVGAPLDHWTPQPQVSSSLESSTSSQEQLNFSASSTSSNKGQNQKTGPGRWKTPNTPHIVPPHSVQPPSRSDLPPPPPPPPAVYPDPYDPQPELPPPPPTTISPVSAQQAADRKKREEQQRWYEKEKARLEEERERKRREQERKLGQIRANPVMPVQPHNNGGAMPPPHHQPPMASMAPPQPYHAPQPQPLPSRPEKLSSLPRSAVPPPAAANSAAMDTVIRELLPQQQPRTIERRDLQYITISKEELSTSDSLSPDPWKRDAREKAEKQQQLHIVDLLDKEIQELQAKPERTAEESDRLRKLMLEWQFQKRLQESKQSDDDEEEEDDEDMDAMLIMQRLEAEKRARQQTAVPAISVLDLLQDEERRRKQQLEEIRKREAEERVKQEEERRWREEERVKREAEEKRRQEEEYYARLEAERRRQHEEAERKLLTPDEPAGLYRPPLPRDYNPPAPHNPTNTPPPPPQRNTSYLKTQVISPDTLYTAKFVSYAGDDEDEEEAYSAGSGGQSGFNSHTGNSTGVVGSGEVYNDPRDKWTKSQEQENSIPSDAPESLTFKERQRLFSQGKEVSNKVKASRKLMELENELNTKQ